MLKSLRYDEDPCKRTDSGLCGGCSGLSLKISSQKSGTNPFPFVREGKYVT